MISYPGRTSFLIFETALLLLLAGCGTSVGPTAGVVRFEDGTPVTSGSIEFRRRSDKARFASRISAQGMFQPATPEGDVGLPAGAYDVVVVQIVLTEDLALEAHTHGHTVPRRYADYYTTDLEYNVAPNEVARIEIVVQADGDGSQTE